MGSNPIVSSTGRYDSKLRHYPQHADKQRMDDAGDRMLVRVNQKADARGVQTYLRHGELA